jgi:hypothetical protein
MNLVKSLSPAAKTDVGNKKEGVYRTLKTSAPKLIKTRAEIREQFEDQGFSGKSDQNPR